jgi:tetratricopeptide (TPR) repeat protein
MFLRRLLLVALLAGPLSFFGSALAQGGEAPDGGRELALGREAYARGSYQEAVGHLSKAVQALGGAGEREVLADAYLRLGMAHLVGLAAPAQALPAFLSSAELAGEPATAYLWAALAAEKLGQAEVAARLEAKALITVAPAASAPAEPSASTAAPVAPMAKAEETALAPAPQPEIREEGKGEGHEEEKVDAFQYFFGKKKPKPAAGDEKPPAV